MIQKQKEDNNNSDIESYQQQQLQKVDLQGNPKEIQQF